jgi:hypothetical protein
MSHSTTVTTRTETDAFGPIQVACDRYWFDRSSLFQCRGQVVSRIHGFSK